jgi:alpha-1,3-glucan synthase
VLERFDYDIYHTSDFHGALAPLYMLPCTVPLVLTLHNAEYQGNYPLVDAAQTQRLQRIFNLPKEVCEEYSWCCGTFNLMWAAVKYLQRHQRGFGASAVSVTYAQRCHQKYDLLWQLPRIAGLPNPMPDEERVSLPAGADLPEFKAASKAIVQQRFGLEENPNLRLMVFVGRWSHQKGIDLIADMAEWLLTTHPCQLVVVGPVVDNHGVYAAQKLTALQERYPARLFVRARFFRVPMELHMATDICLMPSRDEPFGYVDIEFGLYGALCVGFEVGGLGKMPGVYACATTYNRRFLTQQLRHTVDCALQIPVGKWREMMEAATQANFPVSLWSSRLDSLYSSTWSWHYKLQPDAVLQRAHARKRKEVTSRHMSRAASGGASLERMPSWHEFSPFPSASDLASLTEGGGGSTLYGSDSQLYGSDSQESLVDLNGVSQRWPARGFTEESSVGDGSAQIPQTQPAKQAVRFLTFGIDLALTEDGGPPEESGPPK